MLDHFPKGTQCRVPFGDQFELYIQTSSNEEQPVWQSVGVFHQNIDEQFIKEEIDGIFKQ